MMGRNPERKRVIKFRFWNYFYIHGKRMEYSDVYDSWNENRIDMPIMQFTGLLDKNGVDYIYEGDIIDIEGSVKGNVYEMDKKETDIVIEGMGTKAWRDTEQKAMERGCRYAE